MSKAHTMWHWLVVSLLVVSPAAAHAADRSSLAHELATIVVSTSMDTTRKRLEASVSQDRLSQFGAMIEGLKQETIEASSEEYSNRLSEKDIEELIKIMRSEAYQNFTSMNATPSQNMIDRRNRIMRESLVLVMAMSGPSNLQPTPPAARLAQPATPEETSK